MVRGLFNGVNFPYAHFATKSITADTAFPVVWEAVEHLQISGLNVMLLQVTVHQQTGNFIKCMEMERNMSLKPQTPIIKITVFTFSVTHPILLKQFVIAG